MKNSYLTNLLLLVIVTGLFWLNYRDQDKPPQQTTLSSVEASQIQQIKILKPQGNITLTRQAEQWQISEPFSAPASPTRIELLLSQLNMPVSAQFKPQDNTKLAQFGLEPAEVSLWLDQLQFLFGEVDPLSQQRYILFNQHIYLVNDTVFPLLRAGADSFIDNRLFPRQADLDKLELPVLDRQQQLTAQRINIHKDSGSWHSDLPHLTSDQLLTLVDNWQYAQALQVKRQPDSTVTASATIRLWINGDDTPVEFSYRPDPDNLILSKNKLDYIFPKAKLSELLPGTE